MRIAFIAVSRKGIEITQDLLKLYPAADIYVPPRFIGAEQDTGGQSYSERIKASGRGANSNDSGGSKDLTGDMDKNRTIFGPESRSEKINRSESITITGSDSEQNEGNASSYYRGGDGSDNPGKLLPLEGGFPKAVAAIFQSYDALIFISAVAVAVRGIAPCLRGKAEDPAVVVVDEGGCYAISLLSGHLGGANELTERVAEFLEAEPVITTATDGRGLPAFDDLARRWGWKLENLPDLKKISSALLEGREIMLYSSSPLEQTLKQCLEGKICYAGRVEDLARAEHGVVLITNLLDLPPLPAAVPYIVLRPRNIAVGVGCRRGVSAERIIDAVKQVFVEAGLSEAGLFCLATGEFKADEEGIIEAARHFAVPLKIFGREEIASALGNSKTSAFVEKQVGVGAVAEPCARLGSGGGEIFLPVRRSDGITLALAGVDTGTGEVSTN